MGPLDEQRITIREYIDLLLKGHAREHTLNEEQLRKQATEYERRLSDLNHAHAEAQRVLNTYLPRESYDVQHKELILRVEKLERNESNMAGRFATWGVVFTIVVALLTIGINLLVK